MKICTSFTPVAQDCLFDGVHSPEVDAVYANSAICGKMAGSYPAPHVSLRWDTVEQQINISIHYKVLCV